MLSLSLRFASLLCVLSLFSSMTVLAKTFPTPTGFVTDCCQVMTQEEKKLLDDTLSKFQQETSNQIAVAFVNSLEGDSVENYANELFRAWKIGEKSKNNGVLLIFAMQDRKIRIEVGYGLEGAITDLLSKRIIDQEITPAMKAGKPALAATRGVEALMLAAKGEYNETSSSLYGQTQNNAEGDGEGMLPFIIGALFLFGNIFSYAFAYMARSKSIWAGGIGGAVLGGILMLFLGTTITAFVLLGVFTAAGFILDAILSATYSNLKAQGRSTSFWDTGGGFFTSGGGSSSGGGGFGGFGGGSSGGGGASGGW